MLIIGANTRSGDSQSPVVSLPYSLHETCIRIDRFFYPCTDFNVIGPQLKLRRRCRNSIIIIIIIIVIWLAPAPVVILTLTVITLAWIFFFCRGRGVRISFVKLLEKHRRDRLSVWLFERVLYTPTRDEMTDRQCSAAHCQCRIFPIQFFYVSNIFNTLRQACGYYYRLIISVCQQRATVFKRQQYCIITDKRLVFIVTLIITQMTV